MFFPNRFQNKPQDDEHDINEFHGPPPKMQPQERGRDETSEEEQKREENAPLSFLSSSSIINIPRQQRHSAPPHLSPHLTPRLFPMSTPPETLRKSFYQIFKPALDELKGEDTALNLAEGKEAEKVPSPSMIKSPAQQRETKPKGPKDEEDGKRTPTPVSMLLLKSEF